MPRFQAAAAALPFLPGNTNSTSATAYACSNSIVTSWSLLYKSKAIVHGLSSVLILPAPWVCTQCFISIFIRQHLNGAAHLAYPITPLTLSSPLPLLLLCSFLQDENCRLCSNLWTSAEAPAAATAATAAPVNDAATSSQVGLHPDIFWWGTVTSSCSTLSMLW